MKKNLWVALAMISFLGGCASSTPPRYHALAGTEESGFSGSARMLAEVSPITFPNRTERAEIAYLAEDGQMVVMAFDYWAGSLPDEMRLIVDRALWRDLRAADIYQIPVAEKGILPHYRLNLAITRFEAGPSDLAFVEAVWTARRLSSDGKSAVCRYVAQEPLLGREAEQIAAALAAGSEKLAKAVTSSLQRLEQGASDPCQTAF